MNNLRVNLTGKKFGLLNVIEFAGRNKHGDSLWSCVCECGTQTKVRNRDLQTGNTRSCGCLRIIHGHARNNNRSQAHIAWSHMKQRCINENSVYYANYGKRGITVCDRWLKFENFIKDMGEPPTKKHSLDRIDNNKGYCLKNCRWTTRHQQQGNMRTNHIITFSGKTQCLAEWSREVKINQKTLWNRLVTLGWSVEKSLTKPIQKQRRISFQDIAP